MNAAPLNPASYNEAYAVLKKNADLLQSAKDPDIDALVPLVEESMAAYKICTARLTAVREALAEHIKPGAPTAATADPFDDDEPTF